MLEQLTLACFFDAGGFTRNLRRIRAIYRRQCGATLQALATSLPAAVSSGVAAGLHVYVQLPQWCDERTPVEAARAHGLLIEGASWHRSEPQLAPPALVLGCGALDEQADTAGLRGRPVR